MNDETFKSLRKEQDPVSAIKRMLHLSDEDLRHYRVLQEDHRDRKRKLNNLLKEVEK